MKRNSFEHETIMAREDFDSLIDREGGKAAGLHLMDEGLADFLYDELGMFGASFGQVPWHPIPTQHYKKVESVLRKRLQSKSDRDVINLLYDDGGRRELLEVPEIKAVIDRVMMGCQRKFPDLHQASLEAFAPAHAVPFHLRSSTTTEDFRDDRYYGTFLTKEREGFFYTYKGGSFCSGSDNLLELMLSFYARKFHASGRFEIDENESLGMVLMPTVTSQDFKDRAVIVYSAYPEDRQSPALIEVWEKRSYHMGGAVPLQLMKIHDMNNIQVIPSDIEPSDRIPAEHFIDGQPSVVDEHETEALYRMAKLFERDLDYPVNIEAILVDGMVVPVQLRPVPHLSEKRDVKQLGPVPENAYVVAETPFVIGSFRKTARLVMPHYKNGYEGHQFKEPVIVWHTERQKGYRFYDSDKQCIAMLNPEQGAALTHDSSLVPTFGEERDKFAFMGLPFPGIRDKLLACMQEVEEPSRGETGKFSYTPFAITIESDGRKGRAYVDRQHASHFQS